MQERASLRKKQQARRSTIRLPHSLQPLKNRRIPRSIATLRDQIKKYNTSDVDVLIPHTKRNVHLEPLPPKEDAPMNNPTPYNYGITTSRPAPQPPVVQEPYTAPTMMNSVTDSSTFANKVRAWQNNMEQTSENTENEVVVKPPSSSEPVLITEASHKCDDFQLVEGKTLKFYSQYLQGRLASEYDKPLIDAEVVQNNKDAELLEQKLQQFLDPEHTLPDGASAISKFHRLDESKKTKILPGGKCLVERMPCRLLRKTFPLTAHEHVKRRIVEN